MVSDVYYSGMRCKDANDTVVHKLRRLFDSSGISQTVSKGDLHAISKWIDMNHPSNDEMILREIDAVKAAVDHIGPDKCGFFNLAYDVTPHCDCAPYGDVPMVPDVGMFASKDPVACDMATGSGG
jgi:hypothetical protein